jgi:hypothetical protein
VAAFKAIDHPVEVDREEMPPVLVMESTTENQLAPVEVETRGAGVVMLQHPFMARMIVHRYGRCDAIVTPFWQEHGMAGYS